MPVWRLIFQEIWHRKLNFGLGLCSVAVAVGCLVGAFTLLRAHDLHTEQILTQQEAEIAERMQKLEDDYRRITKNMGFNVLILPKNQNLGDLYADDYATEYFPEEYATRLAESKIVTVNHLLPTLQQKLKWPEQQRTILLIGTRGQVPILHRNDPKKPIQEAVPPGTMVVGHELAQSLGLEVGDRTELLGREFTIEEIHSERGNKDDVTIWIDLTEAQELLEKQGQINAILALECHCEGDRLSQIRAEISGILPDTQVIEFASKAIARAEARNRAAEEAQLAVASEQANREKHRQQLESFFAVLVPVVLLGCVASLAYLSFSNVRTRRSEIGILRAIGLRSQQILGIFLGKSLLMGLVGALVGTVAGFFLVSVLVETEPPSSLLSVETFLLVVVSTPLLSALAGWLPALIAAQQDPAVVLRDE